MEHREGHPLNTKRRPSTGVDWSGSTGSSRCSPGSAAGAPLMAWATCTGPRFGSSQCSTGGMGVTLVIWDLLFSHGTSRGPSTEYKAKAMEFFLPLLPLACSWRLGLGFSCLFLSVKLIVL
ncbi:hypothetical protein SRHO_G00109850 [Serrasalmus rhombeus]